VPSALWKNPFIVNCEVAAGFMPAFNFKKKLLLVFEREHKARGYLLVMDSRVFEPSSGAFEI
jgi:hypothetical protein